MPALHLVPVLERLLRLQVINHRRNGMETYCSMLKDLTFSLVILRHSVLCPLVVYFTGIFSLLIVAAFM